MPNRIELSFFLLSQATPLGQPPTESRSWTNVEVWLAIALLAFGITLFVFQHLHLKSSKAEWTSEATIRFFGFPLVIIAALFLIVAGYSDQQVAPVFGLLGAIAGYLFGKTSSGS
ncbi:hypothetical protein [Planctomycetes bacterium CA13]|uniref:hypothetical protein n=1 Tax=Novipirellula herctigrandis TaxID=2527986 RepID=UPI0011B7938E